jgi:transposase-like protein
MNYLLRLSPSGIRFAAWLTLTHCVIRSFRRRWFIITCVRWYLRFKLSYRDLADLARELGVSVAPSTILRRVIRYVPDFEKCWQAYERPVGDSWRADETYLKVGGQWITRC